MFCTTVDLSSFYKQLSQRCGTGEELFNQTHSSAVLLEYKSLNKEHRWGLGGKLSVEQEGAPFFFRNFRHQGIRNSTNQVFHWGTRSGNYEVSNVSDFKPPITRSEPNRNTKCILIATQSSRVAGTYQVAYE